MYDRATQITHDLFQNDEFWLFFFHSDSVNEILIFRKKFFLYFSIDSKFNDIKEFFQ